MEPDKNFMFTSSQMCGLCCDCFKKVIVKPVTGDRICESVSFDCRKDFGWKLKERDRSDDLGLGG